MNYENVCRPSPMWYGIKEVHRHVYNHGLDPIWYVGLRCASVDNQESKKERAKWAITDMDWAE